MNVEELKLVLSAVQSVSGDALQGAMLYIGFLLLKEVLGYLVGAVAIVAIYKAVRAVVGAVERPSQWGQALKRILKSFSRDPGTYLGEKEIRLAEEMAIAALQRSQQ